MVLYTGGKEVASLQFNVAGTDNINWFSQNNLVQSPWSDLKGAKNLLNFAIPGACCSRGFEITASYGGCPVDVGWLVITGSVCSWETKHPVPSILYSKQSHAITWHRHHGMYDKVKKLSKISPMCRKFYHRSKRTCVIKKSNYFIRNYERQIREMRWSSGCGSKYPVSSPGYGHCVLFLGKTPHCFIIHFYKDGVDYHLGLVILSLILI